MLLYIPDELSVDEAKAIATQLFAIAFDQEEVRVYSELRSRQSQFQSGVRLNSETELIRFPRQ
jgi:hypothetical protein